MASTGPWVPILVVLIGTFVYYTGIHFFEPYREVSISTNYGDLKGYITTSRDGREYSAFKGIPYAQPPVGKLRFQPPVAYGKWQGIRDATQNPPVCTQLDLVFDRLDGQEDCLFLNVYTPRTDFKKLDKENLLPVMIFIHGGYFMFGSQDMYGPHYFLDEDIVLVTLNYRLGALGFLNSGIEARGNMGLKDQIMAMKWVKAAIRNFGGNPDSVTIFGESAGGVSVNLHMISPLSERLFNRAISQSGTGLCPFGISRNTQTAAKSLGKKLNCPIGTTEALMACLMSVDALKIAETQSEIQDPFHSHDAVFGPSVEFDPGVDEDLFLYEDPTDSAREGEFARVPWMAGFNSEDGCFKTGRFIFKEDKMKSLFKKWKAIGPTTLIFEKDDIISEQILEYYFGKVKNNFTIADYTPLTNMYTDRFFAGCTDKALKYHAANSPAYGYYLSYNSNLSFGHGVSCRRDRFPIAVELVLQFLQQQLYTKVLGWPVHNFGTCHVDDLQYLFPMIKLWEISPSSKHYEFSKTMVKIWTSFAKYGQPMDINGVKWEKVNKDGEVKYMNLDYESKMISPPFKERIKFWDTLHV